MSGTPGSGSEPRVLDPLDRLLLGAGRADAAAFAELYDTVAPRVLGLLNRVVGDPREAEDVAREVFLEAWRTAARFDPTETGALVWLMAMTHRSAVARVRSRAAAATGEARQGARPTRGGGDVLAGLSPVQVRALEVAYYDGQTDVELSRRMQVAPGAARSCLNGALRGLRGARPSGVVGGVRRGSAGCA